MRSLALVPLALLSTVTTAVLALGTTVPADAATAPTMSSPTQGQVVPSGWTGPITADFTGADPGTYSIAVSCTGAGPVDTHTVNNPTGPVSYAIPAITGPDSCSAKISDPSSQVVLDRSFTVDEAPLTYTDTSISASSFYPTVTDGFRDTVSVTWTQSKESGAALAVKDANGHLVRSLPLGTLAQGTHTATWNGRSNAGNRVPAGSYRVGIEGDNASFSKPVWVRTALVSRRGTLTKVGDQSAMSHSGPCYTTHDTDAGLTDIDCWGGRFGRATYTFKVPSTTYSTTYAVTSKRPSYDLCCQGKITNARVKASSTTYRVLVTATGWRAVDVYRVRLTYSYKARI